MTAAASSNSGNLGLGREPREPSNRADVPAGAPNSPCWPVRTTNLERRVSSRRYSSNSRATATVYVRLRETLWLCSEIVRFNCKDALWSAPLFVQVQRRRPRARGGIDPQPQPSQDAPWRRRSVVTRVDRTRRLVRYEEERGEPQSSG